MKEIKAIIVDLDRTLLRTDKTVSPYTCDVMKRCREKGFTLVTATARPPRGILPYHEQIGFDVMITMNGAKIILPDRVMENSIPRPACERILSALLAVPDTVVSVETGDDIYSSAAVPEWNTIRYDGFPTLPTGEAIHKILASSTGEALYAEIDRILPEEVHYIIASGTLVQIMSKQTSKWNGIKAALGALGISPEEAVYFGDDNDDIEPVRMCGMGVAPSNAIQAVAEAADYITSSNDEDGVARFIEENLL